MIFMVHTLKNFILLIKKLIFIYYKIKFYNFILKLIILLLYCHKKYILKKIFKK